MSDKIIKLKSWHFLIAILMFFIVIGIISNLKIKQMPLPPASTSLTIIEDIEFNNENLNFVFFYDPDSELCEKMRFKVEKITEKDSETINFYALDVNKSPKPFYEHNVSGIPNILIFKGDEEIKRIMGVVSYKNLSRIVQRIEYEHGTKLK